MEGMDMNFWKIAPLIAVTAIYVVQAAVLCWTRQWAQALIITGYIIAGIGLIASL
jgi:hypothetical protein